jgi:hypothetical protein
MEWLWNNFFSLNINNKILIFSCIAGNNKDLRRAYVIKLTNIHVLDFHQRLAFR